MAKRIHKRAVTCPIRHVKAFVVKYDDGKTKVKCGNLKLCGDDCPYLKNPDYKPIYKRAPDFRAG